LAAATIVCVTEPTAYATAHAHGDGSRIWAGFIPLTKVIAGSYTHAHTPALAKATSALATSTSG
tara:strand:+ start:144 stop:335 length:192 start_codon:yes stop_codon:yes gene_type:complete